MAGEDFTLGVEQNPSKVLFVVLAPAGDRERVISQLRSIGEIQDLETDEGLLLINVKKGSSDPRVTWEHISRKIGQSGTVQPVLIDRQGQQHYPTGEVTVRFEQIPTDEELKGFADTHGLRLRNRNRYVPAQAILKPLRPSGVYLPDLVKELSGAENIKSAWANTLSHYERVKSHRAVKTRA
jgi:hypothetical protein